MDARLDLYNAVNKYQEEMNPESESIMLIEHSRNEGGLFIFLSGEMNDLSKILSDTNGYINSESKQQKDEVERLKKHILNIAINKSS
jgi:hypothetical protein